MMSCSNDDLLCLSWKDFRENFDKCLRDLQGDANISDVTLVGEDGKIFPAQKALLAASSSFFAGILKDNPSPEVVILIRGVDAGVLKSLLDFIHVGEVRIKQDQLNQLLETMEEFKLQGLTESTLFKEEQTEDKIKSAMSEVQSISQNVEESVAKIDHGMKYSIPNRNSTDYSEWDDQILTVLERKIGKKSQIRLFCNKSTYFINKKIL